MLGIVCSLITALTCVDAAITLTQEPIKTVSAGQQVVLNCNIQRYDRNYVSWYKQVPGGVPQYVLSFLHSNSLLTFGTRFSSDQFSSKYLSEIDFQVIIQAERGDSALYFCQTWDDSAEEDVSQ
uniref:Ig-like domain-containing protein n=1 Tax=Poecilia reticulata TaxID=8081 RepID=A0A3P9NHB1_POERE